jgi:cyclic pyranopterin phosphate synthase
MTMSKSLTHIDAEGNAAMVDVSAKPRVRRTAVARGTIHLLPSTIELVKTNSIAKGNVLATARVAGIMAAKRCSDLIPLCHNIEIEHVELGLTVLDDRIDIEAKAVCTDKTGIEMEALTAVSVAALTIYDMCKAVDRQMTIGEICLVRKDKEIL